MGAEHPLRIIQDVDLAVPTHDGLSLATDVYRYADNERRPTLLQRVAYGKSLPTVVNGALNVALALRRGYNVVVQDCRGTGRSQGIFAPFEREAADGCRTIEWLRKQEWALPEVCTFGRSYSGINQWLLAREEPPGLMALAPMLSGDALTDGWLSRDGVVEYGFALLWSARVLGPIVLTHDPYLSDPDASAVLKELLRVVNRGAQMYEEMSATTLAALSQLLPVLERCLRSDGEHAPAPLTTSVVPALLMTGWYDICAEGCLRTFERLQAQSVRSRLIVGPWAHGGSLFSTYPSYDFGASASADGIGLTDLQLDWFDECLGRAPSENPPRATVRYFTMGRNTWSDDASWPPKGVVERRYFLGRGGSLSEIEQPTATTELAYDTACPVPTIGGQTFLPGMEVAANSGPRDQAVLAGRDDVAWFSGEVLKEPVSVNGRMRVHLMVSPHRSRLLVCARVVDRAPDGTARLVAEGARWWDGMAPAVVIEVGSTSHEFAAGHQVTLLLSNSSWPRYAVGPAASSEVRQSGKFTILLGGRGGSALHVDVCKE